MRATSSALGVAMILVGLVCTAGLARAQNAAPIAQALFADGRKLMDQKRYEEACSKFAASQKADPALGTLLNLGDCYEKDGQLVLAWQTFHDAIVFARRGNGPIG